MVEAKAANATGGHRVAVSVEVEQIPGSDRKVRVVRHVEDLGIDDDVASRCRSRGGVRAGADANQTDAAAVGAGLFTPPPQKEA